MALILLVEDDEDILKMVKSHLNLEGFDVLTARDGLEALSKVKAHLPNLVVLDIMLPKIDGWEVLLQLRENKETASIPIVMLTAKREDLSKLTAFRHGADDYVTKPFSPDILIARIKAVLRRAGRLSQAIPHNTSQEELLIRIPVEAGLKKILISKDDIFFCENREGKTYLHTFNQILPTKLSLIELEDKLPHSQFFRCHRSFLVNLSKIKEIIPLSSKGWLLALDDEQKSQVPVSRRSVKQLKELLSLR